ncbi:MAG: hypothetical protein NVSMB25_14720 [Thermoleophilaceae bacterium]
MAFHPSNPDAGAAQVVGITADDARRTICLLGADEKSCRLALVRNPNGSVAWRADTFTSPRDPREPERWVAHHGELSVAQVSALVPEQTSRVRRWTREEISAGLWVEGSENFLVRERRERSLARLDLELRSTAA